MKNVAEIACTKAQASLVEWALGAMTDYAGTEDAGYTEDDLPTIVGSGRKTSLSLPSWRTLTDLLYRLEQQYPDMARAEGGQQARVAAALRLASSLRATARLSRAGKSVLQKEAAAAKRIDKLNRSKTPTSFDEWKKRAAVYAKEHESLGMDDILAEDDPYDLKDTMRAAFDDGQPPEDYIEEMFAEDIARRDNDDLMAAEAEEEGMDAEGEDP
jgi:hypothetical protein